MLTRLMIGTIAVVVSLGGFCAPLPQVSNAAHAVVVRPTSAGRATEKDCAAVPQDAINWAARRPPRPATSGRTSSGAYASNPVIRTIATKLDFARYLAVDAKANLAFVGGYTSTNLLDLRAGRIVRTIRTSGLLAVDGRRDRLLIVRCDGSTPAGKGTLSIINSTTGVLMSRGSVGACPFALAVAVATGRAFLLTIGSGHPVGVSVLDTATGVVLRSIRLGASLPIETTGYSTAPPSFVVVAKTRRVFASDTHAVYMLDARSGAVLRTLNAADATLALDGRTGHLFVLSNPHGLGALTVSVLDAATGARLRVFHVNIKDMDFHVKIDAVVVNEPVHRLFIAREAGYSFCATLVVDTTTGAVRSVINEGFVPVAMAIDPRLNRVFVSHQNLLNLTDFSPESAGSVGLLNATAGAVLQTVQVGWLPWVMALDTASGRLFVLNGEGNGYDGAEGTLSVLSEKALVTQ